MPVFEERQGGNRVAFTAAQRAWLEVYRERGGHPIPAPTTGTRRPSSFFIKDAPSGLAEYTFIISSGAVDRMGDVIDPKGWNVEQYRRNPTVLWAHQGSTLPIGKAHAVYLEGNKLKARMSFAPTPLAAKVEQLVRSGHLGATSVGFRPLKFTPSRAPGRDYGIDFHEAELLEFSIVGVPANPEALLTGMSAAKSSQPLARTAEGRKRQRTVELLRLRAP